MNGANIVMEQDAGEMDNTNIPQRIQCEACGGRGWYTVAECCCRPDDSGQCCGDPVPGQEQCQYCNARGYIEVDDETTNT